MDYENKYKEALKKANSIYNNANHAFSHLEMKEKIEEIFPEIKVYKNNE